VINGKQDWVEVLGVGEWRLKVCVLKEWIFYVLFTKNYKRAVE